jgi:UDP-GlcNAc:undecaprenyl-phosphate/decaprenyl-phosphate GlcNAc-1-phosphate transferase
MNEIKLTLIAALLCALLIFILRKLSHAFGMLDLPDERKQHAHPTPTIGGLAMFLAMVIALQFGPPLAMPQIVLLICASVLLVLGMLDDKHNLSVSLRMLIQVSLVLIVLSGANGTIEQIGSIGDWQIKLGLFAIPLSLIAFVGGINAMNMIDGADGMAGSMALISTVGALLILNTGLEQPLDLAYTLIGVLVVFLLFNARIFISHAWVFMGDAGSMWLGLVVGWLMAQVAQQNAEPMIVLWLFGLPLIDTLTVMLRRIHQKKSPFKADRTHIHHVLQNLGFSVGRKVLLAALAQSALVLIGLTMHFMQASTLLVLGSFILFFASYYVVLRKCQSPSQTSH